MSKLAGENSCAKAILCLIFLSLSAIARATEINYYKLVELEGVLTERKGLDCCIDGKEREVSYPLIKLKKPVNVIPANPSQPELDEPVEKGIASMHLVLDKNDWEIFKKNKEKNARVFCLPFHAINGHHMTPVLCEVKAIKGF